MNRDARDEFLRMIEEYLNDLFGAFNAAGSGNVISWRVNAAKEGDGRDDEEDEELQQHQIRYEILESETHLFISAELPATLRYAPTVDIRTDQVTLELDGTPIHISIPALINFSQSYYSIRNRILDIICEKID